MQKTLAPRQFLWVLAAALAVLAGCQPRSPSIPPIENFTIPAVGTVVPLSEVDSPSVTPGFTGMMFVNSSTAPASVVISNTIAEIPAGYGFLMPLLPNAYQVFIYEQNSPPKMSMIDVVEKKVRYVYLVSLSLP
jgi:hypothetical protein